MGTYDTRGGHPISPRDEEPAISDLEDTILGLLEAAHIPTGINDQIMELVQSGQKLVVMVDGDPLHHISVPHLKCPTCHECEGADHHWMLIATDPGDMVMGCKHCPVWREYDPAEDDENEWTDA
jgi:hypothetical protein